MTETHKLSTGRKLLPIVFMVILAFLYYQYFGQPKTKNLHQPIKAADVLTITLFAQGEYSKVLTDQNKINKLIAIYNKCVYEKDFKGNIDPAVWAYIKLKNNDIYVTGYNSKKVIIQYKENITGKQQYYVAKSTELTQYLTQIKKSP